MRVLQFILVAFAVVYLLPTALATLLWGLGEHPRSWRDARWSSAEILPPPSANDPAAIYIFSARTGGLKGALSEHAWIVVKQPRVARYERFDKVGWGAPIRRNAYPPDGLWYSNRPRIVASLAGEAAERAIPAVLAAIADYPYAVHGGYRIFPGPNSNSFVAHVLQSVPQLGASLPSVSVGRDYPVAGHLAWMDPDGREGHVSLFGYAGATLGVRSGFELNILGLVAGVDPLRLAIKIPAFGTFSPIARGLAP